MEDIGAKADLNSGDNSYNVLLKNVVVCPCPKKLPEAKVKRFLFYYY